MQTKKLLQKNVQHFLKSFFEKNPDVLKKYVDFGLTAVETALPPLNKLMKHLVVVQGGDPNSVPGARQRKALEEALFQSFGRIDDQDYESTYDTSWAHSKFEKTQKKLTDLNLTKDSFKKFTDLTSVDSPEQKYEQSPFSAAQAAKYAPDVKAPEGSAVVMSHFPANEDPAETLYFEKNKKNVNRIAPPSPRREEARIDLARDVQNMIESADLPPEVKRIMKAKAAVYKQRAENPAIFEEEKAGFLGEEAINEYRKDIADQITGTVMEDKIAKSDLVDTLSKADFNSIATAFDPRVHGSDVLAQLSSLVKLLEKKSEELDAARRRGTKTAEELAPAYKRTPRFPPKQAPAEMVTPKGNPTNGTVPEMDLSAEEDVREIGLKTTPLHQDTAYSKKTTHRKSLSPNTFRRVK